MNILISKPDSLGDQLIAAGYVQQLLEANPDARIIWHVRTGMDAVAELLPKAGVFLLDLNGDPVVEAKRLGHEPSGCIHFLPYPVHPLSDWGEDTTDLILWWKAFIEAISWDTAISPMINRSWLSDLTIALSRAPRRVGFEKNDTYQLFTGHVAQIVGVEEPYFTEEIPSSLEDSEYTQLGRLFTLLFNDDRKLSMDLNFKNKTDDLLSSSKKMAAIAPGVGENIKRAWPFDNFLKLSEKLKAAGYQVIWIEGPDDGATFKEFPTTLDNERRIFSPQDLPDLSRLIHEVSLFICNDTAYTHLAAALDCPTVALFGAGQERRFFPQRGRVKVLQGDIPCKGCQWYCLFDYRACIKDIPVAKVMEAIEKMDEESDFSTIEVPITPPLDEKIEISEKLRKKMQSFYVAGFWESWSRLQVLHEAAYRLHNCLIERDALREKINNLEKK